MRHLLAIQSPLRYSADLRSLFFLGLLTVIFIAEWTGWFRHWVIFAASGVLTIIACNVKHNHMHSRVFRHGWMNTTLNHWLGFCTGTTTLEIISEHNERHHQHNNTEADFVRCSLVRFRSQILNVICFFPVAFVRLRLTKPSDLKRWKKNNRSLYRRSLVEYLCLYGGTVCLFAIKPWETLVYLGLPWIHGQWWLFTFNLFQHQDADHDDPVHCTRNITSRWFNWVYLNIGYHSAHHLRPALHWSLLPNFHQKVIQPRIDPRLNEKSAFDFYWNWFLGKHRGLARK